MSSICNPCALRLQHIFGQHYRELIPCSSFETVFTTSVWRTGMLVALLFLLPGFGRGTL